ncbi:MAG: hypothetical protein WCQ41_04435 [Bacillota bacterium]
MSIEITIVIYVITFLFFATIVLGSFAIAKMGERANLKTFWLGYLPVIQFFVLGRLIETIDFPNFRIPKAEIIFPLLPVVSFFSILYVPNVPFQVIIVFLCAIIWLYAWNTFFLLYANTVKKANIYTLVGGILILPLYIFIFLLRKQKPNILEEP